MTYPDRRAWGEFNLGDQTSEYRRLAHSLISRLLPKHAELTLQPTCLLGDRGVARTDRLIFQFNKTRDFLPVPREPSAGMQLAFEGKIANMFRHVPRARVIALRDVEIYSMEIQTRPPTEAEVFTQTSFFLEFTFVLYDSSLVSHY